jgi:hypothetical protein
MRKHTGASASLVVCLILAAAFLATAGEKKISKKEVPPAVLSAFEKAYPKASTKGFAKEEEDGKTFYEIESVEGTTTRDILYLANGNVAEIEEGVSADKLPDAVKATVKREYPKGKVTKAEKVTVESVIKYEIHIAVGKTQHGLVVAPDGKVVKQKKVGEEKEEDNESGEKD